MLKPASTYQAASFPIASYSNEDVTAAWASIQQHFPKPKYAIRAAVFNAGPVFTAGTPVFKPFLSVTPSDVQETLQTGIAGAFAFSRAAILAFKGNDLEEEPAGKRGTLIFTGATASLRGGPVTSIFSAGKFSLRALSQSLAKEFGKENIHVAHVSFEFWVVSCVVFWEIWCSDGLICVHWQVVIDGGT